MADGNSIANMIEAGLKATSLRRSVINNNLANLQTPGFRRSDVKFENLLAEALDSGGEIDLAELKAQIFQPGNTRVGVDGNDVNLETEVGDAIKNDAMQKMYIRLLKRTYDKMEMAIRGSL